MPFSVIVGGLRPGGKEKMDGKMARFLKPHWEKVQEYSGRPFSYGILEQSEFVYDTEPACRAVRVVRALQPDSEFRFFKAVQEAFYARNKDTNELDTYLELCDAFAIDRDKFAESFKAEVFKRATQADFELSRRFGISSFPTVVLRMQKEFHVIAYGFAKFEQMDEAMRETLDQDLGSRSAGTASA